MLVFPDGLDVLLEEVEIGFVVEQGGALEVLIVGPKLFDGRDVRYGLKTLFKAALALHEVLIPKFQRFS